MLCEVAGEVSRPLSKESRLFSMGKSELPGEKPFPLVICSRDMTMTMATLPQMVSSLLPK